MGVTFTNSITVDSYNNLRALVGWRPIESRQAASGLANSLLVLVAQSDGIPVGFVRAVGDRGYVALIVDVIVIPAYQNRGIATLMLNKLLDMLLSPLEPGQSLCIQLMSAPKKERFYCKFGFSTRPNMDGGAGMTQWITRLDPQTLVHQSGETI